VGAGAGVGAGVGAAVVEPAPPGSVVVSLDDGRVARVKAPARAASAAPVTVMLHGLCNDPQITCEWFLPGELGNEWQVCPRGNVACGGDTYQWGGSPAAKQRLVAGFLSHVEAGDAGAASAEGAVLVGFSQGAYAAAEIVRAGPGPFVGVVIAGAPIELSLEELRRAGIRRAAFAAGDYDSARPALEHAAANLSRRGFEARYASLGKVGHVLPQASSAAVARLIDWSRDGL
jgi:pimeloyl-ACP methyl ester carboxylesterase